MKTALPLVLVLLSLLIVACEDAVPTDYVPQNVVEGILIVDEPIRGIMLMRSLPIDDTFRLERSGIPDADVRIITGDQTLRLVWRDDGGAGEYYLPDTNYRVLPVTEYRLEVRTADGALLTGATRTPQRIEWVKAPRDARYPIDTTRLIAPDSLSLDWTSADGVKEYIVVVRALDTLGYGLYLDPPTDEPNRRIVRFWESNFRDYNDMARTAMLQGSATPISWFAFKWFGPHEISVYAPDDAFVKWFKMLNFQQQPTYQPMLGSIRGGIGVFGSTSVARSRIFLYKNQP